MNILINQPVGLGDIFWIQPIVDSYIESGYEVWHPVKPIYLDLMKTYLPKDHVHWVSEDEDFPLKEFYGSTDWGESSEGRYVPMTYADRSIPQASTLMSKYCLVGHPLVNWHFNLPIVRNLDREIHLMDTYNLDIKEDYILINQCYGTYPNFVARDLKVDTRGHRVHYMNIEQDIAHGFNAFDWILALQRAYEVHTIETSTCYFVDKYCTTNVGIHMYERRQRHEPAKYYSLTNKVYRNPRWVYHVD